MIPTSKVLLDFACQHTLKPGQKGYIPYNRDVFFMLLKSSIRMLKSDNNE